MKRENITAVVKADITDEEFSSLLTRIEEQGEINSTLFAQVIHAGNQRGLNVQILCHRDSNGQPTIRVLLSGEKAIAIQAQEQKQWGTESKFATILNTIQTKPKPDSFKITRSASSVIPSLFGMAKSNGITKVDMCAFIIAAAKTLHNQSVLTGHADTGAGLIVDKNADGTYKGVISVSVADLCRDGYGDTTPTTEHKQAIQRTIEVLETNYVNIGQIEDGTLKETHLLYVIWRYRNKHKKGAVGYDLALNPVFTEQIQKQWKLLPANITSQLTTNSKKITAAHYLLTLLLEGQQGTELTRSISVLARELKLENALQVQRVRTEKQLLALCDDIVRAGVCQDYQAGYYKGKLSKLTFHLPQKDLPNT